MNYKQYDDIIDKISEKYKIEKELIKAIIYVESSFIKYAYRFESGFYKRYIKNNKRFKSHLFYDEPKIIAASYGLMQIMFTTFEELGMKEILDPEILYDPETNINYGVKYLKRKISLYGLELGIISYNSGSPRGIKPKEEPNFKYLKKVSCAYKKFNGANQILLNYCS
jgi:soluble lytic murein transglycosylase-like protein